MSNLKPVLITLIAAPLGSCMTTLKDTEPSVPLGHNFAYAVPHRENVNLVQAFDDGSTTYFQFKESPPPPLDIRQVSEGKTLSYTLGERYALVKGVYANLIVTVAGHSTTVINQSVPAPPDVSEARTPTVDSGKPVDRARSQTMSAVFAPERLPLP